MSQSVDLYGTAYGNFATHVSEQVRRRPMERTSARVAGSPGWSTGGFSGSSN